MPDLADLAERLRELALSFPETYEDEPWGYPVFKVGDNSMFATMSVAEECVRLTVKLTAEEREMAQFLPYVSTARYVGRYGWVTAEVADDESLEAALEWLRESYWLKAPPGAALRGRRRRLASSSNPPAKCSLPRAPRGDDLDASAQVRVRAHLVRLHVDLPVELPVLGAVAG